MTKIDIYSGFLGAGKTTLIKKMIKEAYHGQKLVLIENEFGEIGIDGGFLQEAGIQITEMNSGCICCSLVGDFGRALKKVIAEYAPDRILIEPSGVGKLSDVIGAVRKVTSDDVQLGNFVTVADATKCKMYMKNFGEFYNNQIETANTIILSRTQKKKKTVRIGLRQAERIGELLGHVCGVLFSPEDLQIVKDGPAERRRFMDMQLSQLRPAYFYALQRAVRTLNQRNALLKDIARNPSLLPTLDMWDEQLARVGAVISSVLSCVVTV